MEIVSASDIVRTDNWRIAVYGKPGVGKTSSIKFLNGKTLILALDNSAKVLAGMENVDVINFDRSKPTEELIEFTSELKNLAKDYDNLVLDNVSTLEKDWFIEEARKTKNGIRNEIQDYSTWTNFFTRVISQIYTADLNILITAWEQQKPIQTASGQQFNQYAPTLRDSVRDTFMGLTDIVGRLVVKNDGERGLILEGNDGMYAKNRLDNRKGCKVEDLFKFEV